MPRKPRLHVPGGLYHVILRGNNRQAIFFEDDDISDFVRFIASQYSRATNKKLDRTGHLFERRHRAILVQTDSYLKELVRYIHLNPLRAGIVDAIDDYPWCGDAIDDYPWCGHQAYLDGNPPPWLTVNWVLSAFAESLCDARRQYARFLQTDCPTSILEKLSGGSDEDHRVLGDDGFIASLEQEAKPQKVQQTLAELARTICGKHDVSVGELKSPSPAIRSEIGLVAVDGEVASTADVARFFRRSQSGMSRAIGLLRQKSKQVNK